MPLAKKRFSKDIIQFTKSISKSDIKSIISDKNVRVLQTSEPADANSWNLINEQLLPNRPELKIRIFGHYSQDCDLSFLVNVANVKNLSIDCLMDATNVDTLSQLRNLNTLSVGIYSLNNFDFLNLLPISLNKLSLGKTKSKKPNLSCLNRFSEIEELYIEGQQNNIEVIGELKNLKKLVLRSISPKDISFLRKPAKLWSLDIKLGGIKDLSQLEGLANLKYLELWQIRGLSDISVISSLPGLQYLFLQSLRNVTKFPDIADLKSLRRIYLENMKGLTDISELIQAPALEEFIYTAAQNMSPEQYQDLLRINSLKRAFFGFGSDKKNQRMLKMMKTNGIEKYSHRPFIFK